MEVKLAEQKLLADRILSRLRPMDPYAILTGGAPRDWFFNNPARDLDIFMHCPPHLTQGMVMDLLREQTGYELRQLGPDDMPDEYKMTPALRAVFQVQAEMPVQIMRMDEPTFKCVVPKFPLNLSQIWYKDGRITPYASFKMAGLHGALIKMVETYPDDHKYILKIKGYYPELRYFSSVKEFQQSLQDRGIQREWF